MVHLLSSRKHKFGQLRKARKQGRAGGHPEDERGKVLFGVLAFLCSESLIFVSFIIAYVGLRLSSNWPPGVDHPKLDSSVWIHSIVLLASSAVIIFAERALKSRQINSFRLLLGLTFLMGAYFLLGEVQDWLSESIKPSTSIIGGPFYILTGFHGLHVAIGMLLQTIMFGRSFIPNNYEDGDYGVTAISWFWHFVDGMWVILFSIFYLWR